VGQILAGLGLLFIGMSMMSSAMHPLRDYEPFIRLMSTFSNPLLGIAAGAGFTALIQSSSASVGVLQTLAGNGVITLGSAVFVLFGQNIGTCITAVMASAGAGRNAKRATLIHLMFNIIGTMIFTIVCICLPLTAVIENALPARPEAQIAAMHMLFNISTTLLLLPLGNYLARLATVILPEQQPAEQGQQMALAYLTPFQATGKEGGLGVSAIVIDQLRRELSRMLVMARDNVADGFRAVLSRDVELLDAIEQREEYIDFLNQKIASYISRLISIETNERGSAAVSGCFTISGNIERIGDHADNLAGYTRLLVGKDVEFSEMDQDEIGAMRDTCLAAISELLHHQVSDPVWLLDMEEMEQRFDDMTALYRRNQLQRMKAGEGGTQEACILYTELLTDFERIGDHVLNIAQALTGAELTLKD
jgi:phosphate:Na+ symporter